MSSLSKSASSSSEGDAELRRGPWTLEEDSLLNHYIACHGEGHWNLLAKRSGLRRTGKSCRLRWLNYLKPDVKHGNLSTQEQLLIIYLHSKWGSSWSKIARHLPGRTDNEIKNYWRTRVQKRAHHLKIDANSAAFQEVLRCFRIPRLQQTIETPSSPSAISSQDSTANPQPFDHTDRELPLTLPPGDEMINFLDHHEESSSTEICTTPSICSSESMNTNTTMTQFPQVSEYPHPPSPSADTIYSHVNIAPIDFCYTYHTSYDMERPSLSFAAMSASVDFQNPVGNRHVDESNWVDNDLADSLWNMDELWQFRNS